MRESDRASAVCTSSAGAKTLTGKPKSRTQRNAQIRGHARTGPTNHALGIAQRDGCPIGAGYDLCTFRKSDEERFRIPAPPAAIPASLALGCSGVKPRSSPTHFRRLSRIPEVEIEELNAGRAARFGPGHHPLARKRLARSRNAET